MADFTADVIASISATFAARSGVDASAVTVIVTSASVRITVLIATLPEQRSTLRAALATELADASAASSFLASAGVTVLSAPAVSITTSTAVSSTPMPPPPPPLQLDLSSPSLPLILGYAGGGACAALLVVLGCFLVLRTRTAARKATQAVKAPVEQELQRMYL